jgi:hypothetical protein
VWEHFVVPYLQLRSILPEMKEDENQLTVNEKKEPWIIPIVADYTMPFPSLKKLEEKGQHRIGSRMNVNQFITADNDLKTIKNIQEYSIEWSEFYGTNITVFKKHKWS